MRRLIPNLRGDTIVEVLIAITVVSAVLGGAFVSSNRSLNVTRQAQERGEALKLVEGQLEQLKPEGRNPDSDIYAYASGAIFCMDGGPVTPPTPACSVNTGGGATYILSIEKTGANDFTVLATWERAGGGAGERLSIAYKLYPL